MANFHPISEVKALTFDVFGTVVDWRKSIAREIKQVGIAVSYKHQTQPTIYSV